MTSRILTFKIIFSLGFIFSQYATVYEALIKRKNEPVAVKVQEVNFNIPSFRSQSLMEEINVLRLMNHDNVVKLLDIFFKKCDDTNTHVYIVMDMAKEDLASLIHRKSFIELEIATIMKMILNGLNYIHKHVIIHRDIKPHNILMSHEGVAKISDFGLSIQSETSDECCGTRVYMAPEVLLYGNEYNQKADVWSVGCILWELITGWVFLHYSFHKPVFSDSKILQFSDFNYVFSDSKLYFYSSRTKLFYSKESRTYEMQLQYIFDIRGSPTTTEWPEFHDSLMRFNVTTGKKLVDLDAKYKDCSRDLQNVMEELVRLSPHDRWKAESITFLKFFGNFGTLPKNIQID